MEYVKDETPWHRRGALFSSAVNADQVEAEAMENGSAAIELGIIDDVIADEHHADLPDHQYNWNDEDIALEHIAGPVISEIDRRIATGCGYYPFTRDMASLHYTPTNTKVYEICLKISLQRSLSRAPHNQLPIIFELITAEAARLFLGADAESMRTGWPSHDKHDRPTNFKAMIQKLKHRTDGEFNWCARPDMNEGIDPHEPKDEGLDYVVWKTFNDYRLGGLFLLGQCACGDDWENKLTDLEEDRLRRWVHPITYARFLRSFSTPYHIPGHSIFCDVTSRAGITFDRQRLSSIAERNHTTFDTDLQRKIEDAFETIF